MASNAPGSVPATHWGSDDTVVIHHLADLGFSGNPGASDSEQFRQYINYLETLAAQQQGKGDGKADGQISRDQADRAPDLIIVSGGIAALDGSSGAQNGMPKLAEVLNNAQYLLSDRLGKPDAEHVFVVPGPFDVEWASRSRPFDPFVNSFQRFGIPRFSGRAAIVGSDKYIVCTLNTCLQPGDLLALRDALKQMPDEAAIRFDQLMAELKQYASLSKQYNSQERMTQSTHWWDRTLKYVREMTESDEVALRKRVYRLVADILPLGDVGLVSAEVRDAFDDRPQDFSPADDRLKILVTHHPLRADITCAWPGIAEAVRHAGQSDVALAQTGFASVLRLARERDFLLALHGHTGGSQVLAELGAGGRTTPLRQIGAPSLRTQRSFNEIVATRNPDKSWHLEMRVVYLPVAPGPRLPTVILLNTAAEAGLSAAKKSDAAEAKRRQFQARMRIALRALAEDVESNAVNVPANALNTLKDMVREDIFGFDRYATKLGLALKTRNTEALRARFELEDRYIEMEPHDDERYIHPFNYPTSAAAWALILGRELRYPADFHRESVLTDDDCNWLLRRTGKYEVVRALLNDEVAAAERSSGWLGAQPRLPLGRARKLRDDFTFMVQEPAPHLEPRLDLRNTYENDGTASTPFEEAIYIPVPWRPDGEVAAEIEEIGTLVIEVKRLKTDDQEPIITDERVDMLRVVSDLICAVLTSSDALRRPEGSWYTDPWVQRHRPR